jgi:hypothetical protein
MTYRTFGEFLLEGTGVTTKLFYSLFSSPDSPHHAYRKDSPSSLLFQPFKSKSDILVSSSSLITGSVVCSVYAILAAAATAVFAVKSLVHLAMLDPSEARNSIGVSANALLMTIASVIGAILSPVINAIDLIGSIVTSLSQDPIEKEINQLFTMGSG